jgi:hypothetical protein
MWIVDATAAALSKTSVGSEVGGSTHAGIAPDSGKIRTQGKIRMTRLQAIRTPARGDMIQRICEIVSAD